MGSEGSKRAVDGRGLRVAIIVARFNEGITEGLLAGAREALAEAGVAEGDVTVARVPGAFELPLAARVIAARRRADAIVCLGAVVRGETPHFEYVSRAATDGCRQVALDFETPIGFGVLTTDTIEQAEERSATGTANKGAEAVRTAIEMAAWIHSLGPER